MERDKIANNSTIYIKKKYFDIYMHIQAKMIRNSAPSKII